MRHSMLALLVLLTLGLTPAQAQDNSVKTGQTFSLAADHDGANTTE